MKNESIVKRWVYDILVVLVGGIIYGLSVNIFTAPNNIAPGGFTGIATVVNHLIGFPIGIGILLLNLPLFILSSVLYGKEFVFRNLIGTVISSLVIDVLAFVPTFTSDKLLCAIFGGGLAGISLGLMMGRGITTGGTSLLGKLLRRLFPFIGVGWLVMICDGLVILFASFVYKDFLSTLLAVLTAFITSYIMDNMVLGMDVARVAYVISDHADEIADLATEQLGRGITALSGVGWYTGSKKFILMCALRRYEVYRLKAIIRSIDPDAFIIISHASEVLGYGFKGNERDS